MARKPGKMKQAQMDIESLTAMLAVEKFKSADWAMKFRAAEARIAVMNLEEAQQHRRQMQNILGVSDG